MAGSIALAEKRHFWHLSLNEKQPIATPPHDRLQGQRFEKDIILLCVRWYLAYPLSQPGFQLFWAS